MGKKVKHKPLLLSVFTIFAVVCLFNANGSDTKVVVDFTRADTMVNRGLFSYQGFMQIRESGDPLGLDTFKLVNPAGTHTRLEIWINRMEPVNDDNDPNHFNWEKFYPEKMIRFIDDGSKFLNEVEALGMEHLLLLCYTVDWLKDPENPDIPIRDIDEWVEFAAAVVQSFNKSGEDYRLRARFVEVWNEPNLKMFWSGSEKLYMDLFNATAERIHKNYPGVLVGGPALTRIPECQPEKWLEDFLKYCGKNADFISYHTYGESVEKIVSDIKKWAEEFRKIPGKENGKVMITEADNWRFTHHSWEKIKYMIERQLALIEIQDLLWSFHHFCVMAYRESGNYEFGIVYPDGAIIEGTFWPFWLFRNYIGEQCYVYVDNSVSPFLRCVASRYSTPDGAMKNIVLYNKGTQRVSVPMMIFLPDDKELILLYSKVAKDYRGLEKVEKIRPSANRRLAKIAELEAGEGLALTFVEPNKPVFANNDLNYQRRPYLELKPMRTVINLGDTVTLKARVLNTLLNPIQGELRLMRVPEGWKIKEIGDTRIEGLAFGEEKRCEFQIQATSPVEGEVVAPYLVLMTGKKVSESEGVTLPHSIPVHVTVKNPIRIQSYPRPIEAVGGEINTAGLLIINQTNHQLKGTVEIVLPEWLKPKVKQKPFVVNPKSYVRITFDFEIPTKTTYGLRKGKFVVNLAGFKYETDIEINVGPERLAKNAVPVNLQNYYNFDSVAYSENRLDYDRGKMGEFVFPADFIPSGREVRMFGIPFIFPSVEDGKKNCVLPQGQEIPVPPGHYDAVAFIGFGHDGKHPGVWTLIYADGSEEPVNSEIPEWCTPPPPGMRWVMNCPYRYIATGPAEPPCQLFYWEIPANPEKELKVIRLPVMKHAYIFCITLLQK